MVASVTVPGESDRTQSGLAPVFCVVAAITPDVTLMLAMYCVELVLQPASLVAAGRLPACVDVYSATDVLHAAIAASASDIFERTT
jgi:hypothetical protein